MQQVRGLFFFSSRRRHTILTCDWSSDVCSSDLDADVIALAHHADDQAETLLLQLLRGAGPAGLAAMPAYRSPAAGPALLRPLLSLPRAAIDAYARAAGLAWVDDESNADIGVKRNFLRRDIAPRLAAAFS